MHVRIAKLDSDLNLIFLLTETIMRHDILIKTLLYYLWCHNSIITCMFYDIYDMAERAS